MNMGIFAVEFFPECYLLIKGQYGYRVTLSFLRKIALNGPSFFDNDHSLPLACHFLFQISLPNTECHISRPW